MPKPVLVLLLLFCGAVAGVMCTSGARDALEQGRRATTFAQTRGKVALVLVHKQETRTKKGVRYTYWPEVSYEYSAGGRTCRSHGVTPLPMTGTQDWAVGISSRFRVGQEADVYYDPDNPNDAFLVHEYRVDVYVLFLAGVLIACLPIGIWSFSWRAKPILSEVEQGWVEARIARTLAARVTASMAGGLLWCGGAGAALAHWALYAGGQEHDGFWFAAAVAAAIGLLPFSRLVQAWRLAAVLDDVRLLLPADRVRVGSTFEARLRQALQAKAALEELTVVLVCDRTEKRKSGSKTIIDTREAHRSRWTALAGEVVTPGEVVSALALVQVPQHLGPTESRIDAYPRHAWRLEVETRLAGVPLYRGRFPIRVLPA